jgi:predicted nucleotidyltransferase
MDKKADKKRIYQIIHQYLRILKENNLNYTRVYLYGSYAKGNYKKDSDIDLAIVSDDFSGDVIDDQLLLMKLRRKVDLRIEPQPFLIKEFSVDDPYVEIIIETGEEII